MSVSLIHKVSLYLPAWLRERFLTLRWGLRTCRDLRTVGLSLFSPLTILDVGANNGNSFLPAARAFRWWRVFAFEPTPLLVDFLHERARGLANYHVVPKAVGDEVGTTTFNVASLGDGGCSSLLEFSADRQVTWPGRHDLEVTSQIEVEVIRLDSFLQSAGLNRIDFLHIDTQGMDLRVLRSLGDMIANVQAGVMEVPISPDVRLYQNQHTKEESLAFLAEHGFQAVRIVTHDNESNVFFRRVSG